MRKGLTLLETLLVLGIAAVVTFNILQLSFISNNNADAQKLFLENQQIISAIQQSSASTSGLGTVNNTNITPLLPQQDVNNGNIVGPNGETITVTVN